jgi:hypothetical protein
MKRIFGSGGWIAVALFVSAMIPTLVSIYLILCPNAKVQAAGNQPVARASIKISNLNRDWYIVNLTIDGKSRLYLWHEGTRAETLVELK